MKNRPKTMNHKIALFRHTIGNIVVDKLCDKLVSCKLEKSITMKKHIVIKSIALFLSWLTLSPLLLILDRRWELLPKRLRIVLFVLSPLMLIVFAAVLIACYLFYCEHFRVRYFVKPKVVWETSQECAYKNTRSLKTRGITNSFY